MFLSRDGTLALKIGRRTYEKVITKNIDAVKYDVNF